MKKAKKTSVKDVKKNSSKIENEKMTMAAVSNADEIFYNRMKRHHDELRWLYMELYGNDSMFAELCDNLRRFYLERNEELKDSDQKREQDPNWYKKNDMLGMMFYIDNFAGNLNGVESRLDLSKNAMSIIFT